MIWASLLLLLTAAQCCAGFYTSAPSISRLPSHGIIHTNYELCHDMHHFNQQPKQRSLSISMLRTSNDSSEEENPENDESSANDESNDENRKKEGLTWDEMMADPELRQLENESSRKEWNELLLPQRVSQAVTTVGWMFVVGGAILPYFGFAYVRKPEGGIRIGTLDERDFQRELMRKDTQSRKESKPTTISISRSSEETNGHIVSWLHKDTNHHKPCV